MATVRITSAIRDFVKNRLYDLYGQQIEAKQEERKRIGIGNACYEFYVPAKYRECVKQLNDDPDGLWIEPTKAIRVEMEYFTEDLDKPFRTVMFNVPLDPPAPLPIRMRTYGTTFKLLESMAPYEQARKIQLEIDRIEKERDKAIEQLVNGVLHQCATLNQVLKVWPSALDFMPSDVRQKHASTSTRNRSTTKEISIDDDVKVSLMKARMLNTGGK